MPGRIEVSFDTDKTDCADRLGLCQPRADPPETLVCQPDGDTAYRVMNRELTLLHELAHIWHWSNGDGETWTDYAAIVGGEPADDSVAWEHRSEERVANTIAWGLYDHLRRPVDSDFKCSELYVQFEQLTGHSPLGPLEVVCLPVSPTAP